MAMKKLKNLRLQFKGELHEIHLVNFSVDAAELQYQIPAPIKPRIHQGRALISMVDVHLRNMRVGACGKLPILRFLPIQFHYQHIGFRVLVEDAAWNPEHEHKGIFFLSSFTDRAKMVWGGGLLTNYRLEKAELVNHP